MESVLVSVGMVLQMLEVVVVADGGSCCRSVMVL